MSRRSSSASPSGSFLSEDETSVVWTDESFSESGSLSEDYSISNSTSTSEFSGSFSGSWSDYSHSE